MAPIDRSYTIYYWSLSAPFLSYYPRDGFRQVTAPCNVACGSEIMTVNSPGGSTLQCDTWLWDVMPLNSPNRPPYWNSTSGFDFDHITSLRNFIQIGPPLAEKNDVLSIFKMADLSHLGF